MFGTASGTAPGGLRLLDHIKLSYRQATRSVSWKTRATSAGRPSRGGSSSSSREQGSDSRDRDSNGQTYSGSRGSSSSGRKWGRPQEGGLEGGRAARSWGNAGRDSRDSRDNAGSRDSWSNTAGRDSSRDSRGSSSRPQQQQQQQWRQQQRPRQDAAVGSAGDEEHWRDDAQGYDDDDGAADDGEFLYPARPSKASYREGLFGEALYGVAPILAALRAGCRTPHMLLMQEGLSPAQRKDGRALADIQRLVAARGAAVRSVSKHELNMLSGNRPHQGLILDASPLEWQHLEVLPSLQELQQQQAQQQQQQQQGQQQQQEGEERQQQESVNNVIPAGGVRYPVWLALDEVMDPQNLGAMLRSAYCLGASGVLGCSRNCSPLTPVVSKGSAGAAELMTLYSCRSMPRTLADAADKGWAVVGAAAEAGAVPVSQFRVDRPTVLVMGNEGYGLRATVKRCCTQLVQIEMQPPATAASGAQQQLVDSLNVSVATGILLHQLLATARQ